MKMIRITTTSFLLLSLLTLGACKKTVYNTVDQVFSATYTIKPTDWNVDNTSGLFQYRVDLTVPELDDKIVADGGVLVYLAFDKGAGAKFDALPETLGGYIYGTLHSKGVVTIGYSSENGLPANVPADVVLAKIVLLDGTPLD